MSALCSDSGVWASPFPARCLPHDVPHTGHLDPLLTLIAPFPSGCSALYCFQHHSNLSVCSLLGLGSQGSLESVGCCLEFTPRPGACHPLPDPPHRHPRKKKPLWGREVRTYLNTGWGGGGVLFFFLFFLCDMFGVNVAKSSLHLHFLKTLEFRTDVSVTSMQEVAKDIRACHFTPTILHGDPRSETEATACPNPSIHPVPFQDGSTPT